MEALKVKLDRLKFHEQLTLAAELAKRGKTDVAVSIAEYACAIETAMQMVRKA